MITNKITDRITDKITDMTSKLQMLITFATVVRLRPTIYQNAQNSEENLDKGIWYTIFCQKKASNCLNFVFKDQTPTFSFFSFFFSSLFFFKISATCFLLEIEPKQFFFMTQSLKDTRNKNNNKNTNVTRTRTKQRHKQERNKTQTRKQITEQGQNTNLDKLRRKKNRIG